MGGRDRTGRERRLGDSGVAAAGRIPATTTCHHHTTPMWWVGIVRLPYTTALACVTRLYSACYRYNACSAPSYVPDALYHAMPTTSANIPLPSLTCLDDAAPLPCLLLLPAPYLGWMIVVRFWDATYGSPATQFPFAPGSPPARLRFSSLRVRRAHRSTRAQHPHYLPPPPYHRFFAQFYYYYRAHLLRTRTLRGSSRFHAHRCALPRARALCRSLRVYARTRTVFVRICAFSFGLCTHTRTHFATFTCVFTHFIFGLFYFPFLSAQVYIIVYSFIRMRTFLCARTLHTTCICRCV